MLPTTSGTLNALPPGSRVAIIRLRSLGDCVLSTPAIRLLAGARPDLRIAVVAEERFAAVFEGNPDVEQVLRPSARVLRRFAPDLCINFHGGTRSARLTALSGARYRAGFDIFKPAVLYNTPIPTAQEILGIDRRVHTAEHMAAAMFHLGVPPQEAPRATMVAPAGRAQRAPEGPYMAIHPFAATPEKTWPAARFIEVANFAGRTLGLTPVFIGGPGDDVSPFALHATLAAAPLTEVVQLLRDASFFVGNDSGPAHVAAAFGVPQVVLFGPSDHEIWSPWRTAAEVLKAEPISEIPVERVLGAIRRMGASA